MNINLEISYMKLTMHLFVAASPGQLKKEEISKLLESAASGGFLLRLLIAVSAIKYLNAQGRLGGQQASQVEKSSSCQLFF